MYKAYKFRLYPNDKQKELIHKTFGCTRFIYNYFLNQCKENKYKKAEYDHYDNADDPIFMDKLKKSLNIK